MLKPGLIRAAPLVALLHCTVAAAERAEKPNILIILADDLGWGDVSYHGGSIPTPNIDGIAQRGIELDRFYTAPVSSPTRCGLLTGRYPDRFGIRETVIPPWRDYGLDTSELTIADYLGEIGYKNRAIIGKWHLGHSRKAYYPLRRGFTHFYGCLNGAIGYYTHERENELDWHNDWESSYDTGYSTDLIAQEASKCIKAYSGDNPYFLYVAFNAPHSPYEAPEEEIYELIPKEEFEKLSKKEKKGWTYRAMVSRLDKAVGKILDTLKECGDSENTIILFMSDNGGVPGMEPFCSNRPHKGTKFEEWEGGVRNIAAIYWGESFLKEVKCSQVTGYVDILPTIADILSIKPQKNKSWDGISIREVLTGEKKPFNRTFYLGCGAAVDSNYKLILSGRNSRMKLNEDYFTNISENPKELPDSTIYPNGIIRRLRRVINKWDKVVPSQEEIPFSQGQKGFKAPREWKITKE